MCFRWWQTLKMMTLSFPSGICLFIHSQTSTVKLLKLKNGSIFLFHTLLDMWLVIHAEMKVNPCHPSKWSRWNNRLVLTVHYIFKVVCGFIHVYHFSTSISHSKSCDLSAKRASLQERAREREGSSNLSWRCVERDHDLDLTYKELIFNCLGNFTRSLRPSWIMS